MGLVNGINSVRDDAKKEASELKEGINEIKNDAKKKAEGIRVGLNEIVCGIHVPNGCTLNLT
jgi:hypothetical protein